MMTVMNVRMTTWLTGGAVGDVVLLTLLQCGLHALAPTLLTVALSQSGVPTLARRVAERIRGFSAERQRTLNRHVRAQLYYMVAGPIGLILLARCESLSDLMHAHTSLHDRAFALAVSHWLVSLVEDASTPASFVVRVPRDWPPGKAAPSLYSAYLLHHLVAVVAFAFCLATRSLPALGACGLAFELPVIVVNLRDLVREFDKELRWFASLGGWSLVDFCWSSAWWAFLPGRLGPIGLWIYGLRHWSSTGGVGSVGATSRVVYVVLGGFFSMLSLAWAAHMLQMSVDEYERARVDAEGSEASRLLIAVDGIVYDVTAFASRHPGGVGPLRRHSGSLGSSDRFHTVGHSAAAHRLLAEFAVAMLPPGVGKETMEERKARIKDALRQERHRRTEEPYLAAYLTLTAALVAPPVAPARLASALVFGASSTVLGWVASAAFLAALILSMIGRLGILNAFHEGVVPWTAHAELHALVLSLSFLWLACWRDELSLSLTLLAAALLIAHASRLYAATSDRMSRGIGPEERERDAWHGVALDLSNHLRFHLASIIFAVGAALVRLAAYVIPSPASYYVHPAPCAEYGDGVEMGVAYFVYPGGGSHEQLAKEGIEPPPAAKPATFVCNVGFFNPKAADSQRDWLRLGHSTIKMSSSLKTAEAARLGFCGQYLAEFHSKGGGVRQLNLTAWTDDHSAHEWYVTNPEHRKVVESYRSGLLATFSSVLSRLHLADAKQAKFHVRCLYCRALLTRYPEQRFCPECGQEVWEMPLF